MERRAKHPDIRLAARLETALHMLPGSGVLIDVGCDHGRLALAALSRGSAQRVIATDISEASLAKAKALFSDFDLPADFVLADGLTAVRLPQDSLYSIAILGMGGELIADILKKGAEAAKAAQMIVMQPMSGERELRTWLYMNGYAILDENTVRDSGRYYQLISARYCPEAVAPYTDDALLEFGAKCYAKRQETLKCLLENVCASRRRRMERAKQNGVIPEVLEAELNGVIRLLEHWEDET